MISGKEVLVERVDQQDLVQQGQLVSLLLFLPDLQQLIIIKFLTVMLTLLKLFLLMEKKLKMKMI